MRILTALVATLTLAMAMVSCSNANPAPQAQAKPTVLTTFTILEDMAKNVAGDRVDVRSITRPGAEIHDYDPTPSDIAAASDADLILANGFGLEHWVDKLLATSKAKRVTVTEGIEPIMIDGTDQPNPHAWMSPALAKTYVDNIVAALSELDPDGAETFRTNGEHYKAEINSTQHTLESGLAALPEEHRTLVSCEGAFSYLARDAGLREGYIWPVNSVREVTSGDINRAAEFVRAHNVPAVFCESTVEPGPKEQLMRETGARDGGTLYVDSLSPADGPVPTFLDLLRYDATTIITGLNQ
ncbi:metal ABC transporter substrate-binding protein [Corynebacterium sanguinis]|uniref:metal ABC transporter substrate-binding protein n=1 Tax=Corynebacterium sanguinis TaxID=2594913 RepID=UPI00223A6903|nr:metal ABC transporter substrate-binding protein [Corynebacterium sanguinis]MCT2287682.1 metal ABC transporter substrate-binding protein [Corynebacterium sanguinis]